MLHTQLDETKMEKYWKQLVDYCRRTKSLQESRVTSPRDTEKAKVTWKVSGAAQTSEGARAGHHQKQRQ